MVGWEQLGTCTHSSPPGRLVFQPGASLGVLVSTEQRIQVSGEAVLIPELVVLADDPQPEVLTNPPLMVIEILSPDDTDTDTQERARDYQDRGVGTVWIIDPKSCTGLSLKML